MPVGTLYFCFSQQSKTAFFFFPHKTKMESLNLKELLTLSQHYHCFQLSDLGTTLILKLELEVKHATYTELQCVLCDMSYRSKIICCQNPLNLKCKSEKGTLETTGDNAEQIKALNHQEKKKKRLKSLLLLCYDHSNL